MDISGVCASCDEVYLHRLHEWEKGLVWNEHEKEWKHLCPKCKDRLSNKNEVMAQVDR